MSAIRCSCVRPSVLSPMFKCDKHKEKPKEPKSNCCKAPAKIIIGEGISFWECTQCKMSCDTVVSKEQKVCECYQTVNGKVHCALHCPNGYDHSKLNPTPSLNTWDMEIRKIISKHNPKTCAKENNHWTTVNAIKELITLAIQKERADHFVDANKLIEDAVQKEREETRTRLTKFWKAAYAGGHKPDYLDGINNAIKLFNKVNCKNGCWTREHSAFINQECPEHKITFKGVPCVDDKGVEEK